MRGSRHIITDEERAILERCWRNEMTQEQAGKLLGVTSWVVAGWMHRLGMICERNRSKRKVDERIARAVVEGALTVEEAANRCGVKPSTVKETLRRYGWSVRGAGRGRKCHRCEILLKHAPKGQGCLCGWCIKEMGGDDSWTNISDVSEEYKAMYEKPPVDYEHNYIEVEL